ncbi:MAG: hypothetical protein Q8O89_04875, partial [Nanoarchaeota archaeon]|nr:hypothetical protein [Nanoarchaeota archaeon]
MNFKKGENGSGLVSRRVSASIRPNDGLKIAILLAVTLFSIILFSFPVSAAVDCDDFDYNSIAAVDLASCISQGKITQDKLKFIKATSMSDTVLLEITNKCAAGTTIKYSSCLEALNQKEFSKYLGIESFSSQSPIKLIRASSGNVLESGNFKFSITDIKTLADFAITVRPTNTEFKGKIESKDTLCSIKRDQGYSIKITNNILDASCYELKSGYLTLDNAGKKSFKASGNTIVMNDGSLSLGGISDKELVVRTSEKSEAYIRRIPGLNIVSKLKTLNMDEITINNVAGKDIRASVEESGAVALASKFKDKEMKCLIQNGIIDFDDNSINSACSQLEVGGSKVSNPDSKKFDYSEPSGQFIIALEEPSNTKSCDALFAVNTGKLYVNMNDGSLEQNGDNYQLNGYGRILYDENGQPYVCGEKPFVVYKNNMLYEAGIAGNNGRFVKYGEDQKNNIFVETKNGGIDISFVSGLAYSCDTCAQMFLNEEGKGYNLDESSKKPGQEVIVETQYFSSAYSATGKVKNYVNLPGFEDWNINVNTNGTALIITRGNATVYNVETLPACNDAGAATGISMGEIDAKALTPAPPASEYAVKRPKQVKYIEDINEKEITSMYLVSPEWEIVLSITPIAVSKNIPLMIDNNVNNPGAYSDATKFFMEDYEIDESNIIKIATIDDARQEMIDFWSQNDFTQYTTAKEGDDSYYYATYAAWYASDENINGLKDSGHGQMPFIPASLASDIEITGITQGKEKIAIETLDDVTMIEKSYATSNPNPIIIVMTDTFQTSQSLSSSLKDYSSLLSVFYAAKRHAFIFPIPHYHVQGLTEKCAIASAELAYKIDGTKYSSSGAVLETNNRSLKNLGLANIDSYTPGQGYLLILANRGTIPIELGAPWRSESGWEYQSCDYDIARSRLEKNRYDIVWSVGRIGFGKDDGKNFVSATSSMMNRALFYDQLMKKLGNQYVVLSQQIEYPPYSWTNAAFYLSVYTQNDFALYKSNSRTSGFVDPYSDRDIGSGNLGNAIQDATIYINHAHGGAIPSFKGRGKSTIIIDEGCFSITQFTPLMANWAAAFIGTTTTMTGWDLSPIDITGTRLGDFVAEMPPAGKSITMLYGDPLLQAKFSNKPSSQDDVLFKIKTMVRGGDMRGAASSPEVLAEYVDIEKKVLTEYGVTYPGEYNVKPQGTQTGRVDLSFNIYSLDQFTDQTTPEFFPIKEFLHTTRTAHEKLAERTSVSCNVEYKKLYSLASGEKPGLITEKCSGKSNEFMCILEQNRNVVGLHTRVNYANSIIPLRSSNLDLHTMDEGQYSISLEDYCIYINNL